MGTTERQAMMHRWLATVMLTDTGRWIRWVRLHRRHHVDAAGQKAAPIPGQVPGPVSSTGTSA